MNSMRRSASTRNLDSWLWRHLTRCKLKDQQCLSVGRISQGIVQSCKTYDSNRGKDFAEHWNFTRSWSVLRTEVDTRETCDFQLPANIRQTVLTRMDWWMSFAVPVKSRSGSMNMHMETWKLFKSVRLHHKSLPEKEEFLERTWCCMTFSDLTQQRVSGLGAVLMAAATLFTPDEIIYLLRPMPCGTTGRTYSWVYITVPSLQTPRVKSHCPLSSNEEMVTWV
jgi:hypothetical protein